MDAETIKTIAFALIGAFTTISCAYIAARWHITPKDNNPKS